MTTQDIYAHLRVNNHHNCMDIVLIGHIYTMGFMFEFHINDQMGRARKITRMMAWLPRLKYWINHDMRMFEYSWCCTWLGGDNISDRRRVMCRKKGDINRTFVHIRALQCGSTAPLKLCVCIVGRLAAIQALMSAKLLHSQTVPALACDSKTSTAASSLRTYRHSRTTNEAGLHCRTSLFDC